jgi:hypothetical protein
MIDWTEELLAQIEAGSRVVLSYPGLDGYPVVLPFPVAFNRDKRCFTLSIPQQSPTPASEEQVSLTLLLFDPQTRFERFVLFYGRLTETGYVWTFTPSVVVLRRWSRRELHFRSNHNPTTVTRTPATRFFRADGRSP